MTVPATMRASFLVAPHELEVRRVPVPVVGDHDVLVQISVVGLCGSDVHFWEHGRVGDLTVDAPLILGHEASGVVAAVGSQVDPGRIGERVAIEPQRPCRRCHYCLSGHYNQCRSMRFFSAPPENGAFAEFLSVPADFAYRVPDTMTDAAAALLEPLSVGIAAVRKARIEPGSRVLVSGAGPIGMLTAAAARAFGAVEVIVSDPLSSRRAAALDHGATTAVDPADGDLPDESVDSFIDASGYASAIRAGVRALRAGGRAILVGMGSPTIEFDVFLLQSRELVVEGLFRYADTWPTAMSLVDSGAIDLDGLVSETYTLDEVDTAMRRNGDADVLKLLIDPRIPAKLR